MEDAQQANIQLESIVAASEERAQRVETLVSRMAQQQHQKLQGLPQGNDWGDEDSAMGLMTGEIRPSAIEWQRSSASICLKQGQLCDSSLLPSVEELKIEELKEALKASRIKQRELKEKGKMWKDRCEVYERTSAGLQAMMNDLMSRAQLTLPGGAKQSVESVWRASLPKDEDDSAQPLTGPGSRPAQSSSPLLPSSPLPAASSASDQEGTAQSPLEPSASASFPLSRLVSTSTVPILEMTSVRTHEERTAGVSHSASTVRGHNKPGSLR